MSEALALIEAEICSGQLGERDREKLLRIRAMLVATSMAESGLVDDADILLRGALDAQLADDPDDPATAWYLATLGVVLVWAERYEEAWEAASAAREIADRRVPADDPVHVTIRDCAGRAALVLERYEESDRDLTEVLDRLGPGDPAREGTLSEAAARARFHLGWYELAAEAADRAAVAYALAGPEHLLAAIRSRLLVGQSLAQLGRSATALRVLEDAVGRLERECGAGAPELARPTEALAIVLAEAGRGDEAWRLARRVVAMRRRDDGEFGLETADALFTAGLVASRAYEGDRSDHTRDRAVRCLSESTSVIRRHQHVRAPRALGLVLGLLCVDSGDLERAADVLLDLVDDEIDSGVVAAVRALATRASSRDEGLIGAELVRALRRRLSRTYGEDDPATLLVTADLATLLAADGLYDAALREYRRAVSALEASGLLTGAAFDIVLNYALLLWHCGESQLAASTFARALDRLAPASEDARARTSDCLEQMVEELRSRGDLAASDSAASAWVAYAEAALDRDDPRHARACVAAGRP